MPQDAGAPCAGLGGPRQEAQAAAWRDYVAWERSNFQRLEGPALAQRVALAYEQALMPLHHFPEVALPAPLAPDQALCAAAAGPAQAPRSCPAPLPAPLAVHPLVCQSRYCLWCQQPWLPVLLVPA